jgi:hypothetical protein
MNFDWFESNYLLHGNTNWFDETMGRIEVFELSDIYFGFRIRSDYVYRNILFDYIQLNNMLCVFFYNVKLNCLINIVSFNCLHSYLICHEFSKRGGR